VLGKIGRIYRAMKFLLILLAVAGIFCEDLEPQARLLVSKNVENNIIVENRDLTIKYDLYNVGSSLVHNVVLLDQTFPPADFESVRGDLSVGWKSIAPGANISHIVVIKPLKAGIFNFTAAQVTYQPTEEADGQVTYTTAPGEGGIMTEVDFNRKHSPHLVEWSVFAVMCMPSLAIPFLLWWRSHSKYADDLKKSK